MKSADAFIDELWAYASEVPMIQHPWFAGIIHHRWTREQIVLGEVQHYLRVRENPVYFGYIAANAVANRQYELMDVVLENFMEELSGPRSHVDIMLQFLEEAGISRAEADRAELAPGTVACVEMLVGCCQRRSALEGLAMLAFVESQHGGPDGVAANVYKELIGYYGFSPRAAETYHLHASQDVGHGSRQIEIIRRLARDAETQERVRAAAKLGITAFTLEWDGHVQAMTGHRDFWRGVGPLTMRQPKIHVRGKLKKHVLPLPESAKPQLPSSDESTEVNPAYVAPSKKVPSSSGKGRG